MAEEKINLAFHKKVNEIIESHRNDGKFDCLEQDIEWILASQRHQLKQQVLEALSDSIIIIAISEPKLEKSLNTLYQRIEAVFDDKVVKL